MATAPALADIFAAQSMGNGVDEYGNPIVTGGGMGYIDPGHPEEFADPSNTWAAGMQRLQATGAMNQSNNPAESAGQKYNIDYSMLPKTATGQSVAGMTDSPYIPGYNGDPGKVYNTQDVYDDPNYGWITDKSNVTHKASDMLDTVGNYVPTAIAAAMAAATMNPSMLGAQFTGGLASIAGGLGSGLFNSAESLMQGNKFDPLGTAMSLGGSAFNSFGGLGNLGLGDVGSTIMKYAPTAIQLALSRGQISPMQAMMMIGKFMPRGQ